MSVAVEDTRVAVEELLGAPKKLTADEIDLALVSLRNLRTDDLGVKFAAEAAVKAIEQLISYVEAKDMLETDLSLETAVKKAVIRALHHTNGNRRAAARMLKIGKTTLYRRITEYDVLEPKWQENNVPFDLSEYAVDEARREALSRRRDSAIGLTPSETSEFRRLVNVRFRHDKDAFREAFDKSNGVTHLAARRLEMCEPKFLRIVRDFNMCDPGWRQAR